MKIIHYVPPVVVLVIAAAWLAYLRGANSALEQENRSLQCQRRAGIPLILPV